MKITDYWGAYYSHSGKTSDIARQLCFAGLALIWLFHKDQSANSLVIQKDLQLPAFIFVGALALDLVQYTIVSIVWRRWCRQEEQALKGPKDDPDLEAPRNINAPADVVFLIKLVLVIVGYSQILYFLYSRWF